MASLFGTAAQTTVTPPVSTLRVQTSVEGKCRPLFWGVTRGAGNLIWYGDFYAVTVQSGGQQGGKGGMFGSNAGGSSSYAYYSSVAIALGDGPVAAVGPKMWASKDLTTLAAVNLGVFLGSIDQLEWSYLATRHPSESFAYRRTAYVAGNVSLGSSAELPNWTYEVTSLIANAASGIIDANPVAMLSDFLTHPDHGLPGWLSEFNADWTIASNYCLAAGLLVSYSLSDQTGASDFAQEFLESLNIMPVWSDAALKLIPLGDTAITGNGAAYTPPLRPEYDLSDADFLPNQASFGGSNGDPISGQRVASSDQNNIVKIEYLDRASDYNIAQASASDDASIRMYGERASKGVRTWHWFQTDDTANMAAQLALGREKIANSYAFTLRPRFIGLDPGDLITITDEALQLFRQWVRIQSITENADRTLSFLVEEFLQGTAAAPVYGKQVTSGHVPNYNADPGTTNAPIIFEPTDELAGGLEVWAAVSGVDTTLYGGVAVYASYDGTKYEYVTRSFGAARMGALTASLPIFAKNVAGQTVDEVNALSVNLTESDGVLTSVSQTDALGLNTACYVDGEIVSFQTATLTGSFSYDLTYMVRGAFGSVIAAHTTGAQFARLDSSIIRLPFDKSRIGATVYFKFVPFNIWGGGTQTIADAPEYSYLITGSALASPLPVVTDMRTATTDGFLELSWSDIADFRTGIRYKIRRGATWETAEEVGDVAHSPFKLLGTGLYWVSAYCQPAAGLVVFSENPVSYNVAGNMLTSSIVISSDQKANGWLGTFSNGAARQGTGPTSIIRLGGGENILADPDFLNTPDILNYGGITAFGYYEIPTGDIIDVGYVADIYLNCSWKTTGQPVNADILSVGDFLGLPDFLGSASTRFVSGWIEVATCQDGAFAWSGWEKYVPGVYRAYAIKLRFALSTIDTGTIPFGLNFSFDASVKPRIDHYQNMTVPSTGITVTFMPDDAIAYAPFNGGTLIGGISNTSLPFINVGWQNTAGDTLVISALTLSSITFSIQNGGVGVARTGVNLTAEGF